jgi:hypothetical protein
MEGRTREAKVPRSTLSATDIHGLLAAINKLEKRERLQAPPSFPTAHYPNSIAQVLDSLAALCVSQERHEVIATTMRANPSAKSVELVVAANGDVPTATSAHLNEI